MSNYYCPHCQRVACKEPCEHCGRHEHEVLAEAITWTEDLPKTTGSYWYRYDHGAEPEIVEWDAEMGWISYMGDDRKCEAADITGEFWPVKLQPPTNL